MKRNIYRVLSVLAMLALLLVALPAPALAAPGISL